MSRTLIIGVCVLQIAILVQCSGLYSVVGPGTLRSKSAYHVTVSVFNNPTPCKIKVGLSGPDLDLSETVEMSPKSSKIVKFDVPKLKDGDFNLTAAGLSGIEFQNSTKLNFASDQLNIYIQTDKATYKPGDKVQFRVLILDENTRPAKVDGPITIAINDGAKNRIKQWTKVQLTKGVYAGELQLSEQPVLGTWNIEVAADDTTTSKNFEVDKYVLPKFEVEVDAPKDVALADESVRVIIRAKYTYGKPVKGKAVVTAKPTYHYYGSNDEVTAMKTIDIDGKGYAEFNFAKDLKLSTTQYTPPLTILAVVEEELTGVKQNATGKINLHREKYQIQGVDVPYVYNPGEPVVITIVVKNLDGSPVQDTKNPVTLTVSPPDYWLSRPVPLIGGDVVPPTVPTPSKTNISLTQNLNKDGMAKFEVTLPDAEQAYYSVKASYLDVTSYVTSLSKFTKSSVVDDEKLKITVQTKKPVLGKDISIRLSNKSPIPCFVYTIVGRGDIISSEIVEVPENRNYHIFKITPTFAMIPRATIFVHFVLGNDLVFTEETINFDNQFENSISLDVPTQAKPGEDVKINVKTDPESYVGLLGVDQSVLLLKSGNDLDKSAIFQDLSRYDSRTPWTYGYGQYPGTQSGLVTMTNANFPFRQELPIALPFGVVNDEPVYYTEALEYESVDTTAIAENAEDTESEAVNVGPSIRYPFAVPEVAFIALPNVATPMVRKEFPETWIVDDLIKYHKELSEILPQDPEGPVICLHKELQSFPESWIFYDKSIVDGNGISLAKKVPDTITSWVVSAFSLNPKTGLALTDQPSKMRVFQPFFISTNLPYSVKRGEVIAIPVIIFNYLDKNLDAEVTMDNTDKDYEFTEATNEVTESASEDVKRTKTLSIPANSGKSVSFMIRPSKVGQIPLKITAISPLAGDAVHQNLKVEPEGVTTFVNKAVFLNLANGTTKQEKIEVEIPENAIPDSQYIELSVVGNLLGPTIKNLDKLVRMPYGCGEQNMVNFVPNILVLKYLTAIKQLPESIETKAKKFLEIGYQRELMYKHDDGSYSAFGKSDASGSTWLTAYVMKSFHQAIPFTDIDPKVIDEGLQFLAKQQNLNGEFPEVGKVIDSSHSGGTLSLTAFVVLAFLENAESADKYLQSIESGLNYLEKELPNTDDLYSLSLGMTALLLGKRTAAAEKIFAKVDGMAQNDGDRKYWSKTVDSKYSWYGPRSIDVEITSYIVTALMYKQTPEEVLPIIRWLISQRNSNGGFASTQDTVVGLEALIKFAELSGSGTGTMDIEFTTNEKSTPEKITVNPETALILQTHVLPTTTKQVDLTAKGSGSSLAQVSYRYNLADKGQKPQFTVKPVVKASPKDLLVVDVCTQFVPLDDSKKSNMAVMEVSLPSGYTADADSFGSIEAVESVKRVETKNSDSMVIIYFDELTPTERCIPVNAIKSHAVAKQKPAPVVVYDYYDNNKRATDYYEVKSSLCDICEGDDCGAGCGKKN